MRQNVLLAGLLALIMLLVAACGGGASDTPNTGDRGVQGTGTSSDQRGGAAGGGADPQVIRVAIPSDPSSWDMDFIAGDNVGLSMNVNVLPYLFDHPIVDIGRDYLFRDDTQLVGVYAEDYEVSEDGLTWTIRLKEGMQFPDGTPINVETFRWSKERGLSFGANAAFVYRNIGVDGIENFKITDDLTLEIQHSWFSANQPFMHQIGSFFFNPAELAKHATDTDPWSTTWHAKNPGTGGPYIVDQIIPGQRITLKPNPYWPGEVRNNGVEVQIVPSSATQSLLLKKGDIDLAFGLGWRDIQALEREPGVKVVSIPRIEQLFLTLNHNVPPFDNPLFRKAIAHAVPYDEILNGIFQGNAIRSYSVVADGMPGYTPDYWVYETDLDKARSLLAESGVESPHVTLAFSAEMPMHEDVALVIQNSLAQVGIDVTLERMDDTSYFQQLVERKLPFTIHQGTMWINDPEYLVSSSFVPEGSLNYSDYSNPVISALLEEARGIRDEAERLAKYDEAQRILMEDLPWIPIVQPNFLVAMREDLHGFTYSNDQLFRLWTLYKE